MLLQRIKTCRYKSEQVTYWSSLSYVVYFLITYMLA